MKKYSHKGSKRDDKFSKIQIGDEQKKLYDPDCVILYYRLLASLFVQPSQRFLLHLRIFHSFLSKRSFWKIVKGER